MGCPLRTEDAELTCPTCQPCLKHHMAEAKNLGVEDRDIRVAIAIAESVSKSGDKHMLEFANTLVE